VAENELTPEKLAEQIRLLKIEDIVMSTVSTLGQLVYVKLDAKELDQARFAIDAIAALLPTLEGHVDPQLLRDFNQLLANVRLAFANIISASAAEPPTPGPAGSTPSETEPETPQESASDSESESPGAERRDNG